MGSYCELYVNDYPVFSSKSYVDAQLMTVFRESDKRIYTRKRCSRNAITWGDTYSEKDGDETAVEYRVQASQAIDRLNVMGFTFERAQQDFENARQTWLADYGDEDEFWLDKTAALRANGFAEYLGAMKTILASGTSTHFYLEEHPEASDFVRLILDDVPDGYYLGFLYGDALSLLRTILHLAPPESYVVQDITEVVQAGYYDEDDEVCRQSLEALTRDYPANAKVIVLTEGTTDSEVLSKSLQLLYPHLAEYYSFVDFGMRPPGGAGNLANLVKSFAGAGIENRVVFLFDNDTGARSAISALTADLPPSIRVLRYPDIESARAYPTLGPSGLVNLDVNGLAGSIELYYGSDVLESEGQLEPVQWRGYDERLRQYQGEVLHKQQLKERFLDKLSACSADQSLLQSTDWTGIRAVLAAMFSAFDA